MKVAGALLAVGLIFRLPEVLIAAKRNAVMLQLNRAVFQHDDRATAIALLQRAIATREDARLSIHLGHLLVEAGRTADAVPILLNALRDRPADERAHVYLGWALHAEGRPDEALRHWRDAGVGGYFTAEAEAVMPTDPRSAERFLKYALLTEPQQAKTFTLWGRLVHLRGEYPQAADWHLRAYRLSPDPTSLVEAGTALLAAHRPDEARVQFLAAHQQQPTVQIYAVHVGDSFRMSRQFAEARRWYETARGIAGGERGIVERYLGEIDLEEQQFENAIEHFRRSVELSPDRSIAQGTALFQLARAHLAARRTTEAEASLRRAIAIEPAHPQYRLVLGELLGAASRWPEAVIELRLAFRYAGSDTGLGARAEQLLKLVPAP